MNEYFVNFKLRMKQRFMIPPTLVEKYHEKVHFLVDINNMLVKVVLTRVARLEPIDYKVNIDQDTKEIEALLNESIDKDAPQFRIYDEAKDKIKLDIMVTKFYKKCMKMMSTLEGTFSRTEYDQPLMITEDKDGDDVVE